LDNGKYVEEGKQSFSNMGGNVAKVFHGIGKTQLLVTHD
jgi:hypothetical protein